MNKVSFKGTCTIKNSKIFIATNNTTTVPHPVAQLHSIYKPPSPQHTSAAVTHPILRATHKADTTLHIP